MSMVQTQEIANDSSVNMRSIINDIRNNVLHNYQLSYKLRYLGQNIWFLRIRTPNSLRSARVEIIIDEYADPEDRGARGAVFTYGDVPRVQVDLIMNSIMERI
jgi:hypothetical protein